MIGYLLVLAGAPALLAAADPPLGEPIVINGNQVLYAASPSVRAASLVLLDEIPREPVTVSLVCMVKQTGQVEDCISATTPLPAGIDWRGFARLAGLDERAKLDHSLLGVARLRARQTLLASRDAPAHYLVRLDQAIAPGDLVPVSPPSRSLDRTAIRLPAGVMSEVASSLYPSAALRQGSGGRVTVKCAVRDDLTLFCHSGQVGAGLRPGDAEDLIFATYQLFSIGKVGPVDPNAPPLPGAEITLSLNWALPG